MGNRFLTGRVGNGQQGIGFFQPVYLAVVVVLQLCRRQIDVLIHERDQIIKNDGGLIRRRDSAN
ncbi:hypothetical protein KPSA1_01371 [Pseudomonas syringae pv. actinidiae]|uniref:Uncharacterized protein n=1 Tax=Pseudomonas syringae pv. actinidiae TaxID=103796 RepID=A0A2V0QCA1_PSESF|nr:hypothetical protein KPSA1_01371 [Pseudomonas syringae pv. actinidiae]